MKGPIAIIGANLAGGRATEALRTEGFDGRIILIGAERHLTYERPPLSKELPKRKFKPEHTFLRPASFYEEKPIEGRTRSAPELLVDPHADLRELLNAKEGAAWAG